MPEEYSDTLVIDVAVDVAPEQTPVVERPEEDMTDGVNDKHSIILSNINDIDVKIQRAVSADAAMAAYDEANKLADAVSYYSKIDESSAPLANKCQTLVDAASKKIRSIVSENSEILADEFESSTIEAKVDNDDGKVRFTAIVAQYDKANMNKRIYPKEEFEKNLSRVKREIKQKKFVGLVDHPDFFSSPSMSRIGPVIDSVELKDGNVIVTGWITEATQAGQELANLMRDGINIEWSIRGWGDRAPEDKEKFDKDQFEYKGNWIIANYFWEAPDVVVRGAARTKTVINAESVDSVQEANSTGETVEKVNAIKNEGEQIMGEEIMDNVATNTQSAAAPQIDVSQIVSDATEQVRIEARKMIGEQLAAARLTASKEQAMEQMSGADEDFKGLIKLHIDQAGSVEAVKTLVDEWAPKLEGLKNPNPYSGIAVINPEKIHKDYWEVGGDVVERPETIAEVRTSLKHGIKDTGARSWDNPSFVFDALLDNYSKNHPEYFEACLKRNRYLDVTATTTTALTTTGANVPQVLPLLRKTFPMLVPYVIASVQPLNAPDGRVYTLDYIRVSNSTSLADSASFDSTWGNHNEAADKAQVRPSFTYTTLSATEKAIQFMVTSALMQDMQALHNVDAEAELLQASANEIAREINTQFLETLRAGATAGTVTYGTGKPSGYTDDTSWYDMLAAYIGKVGGYIRSKTYVSPKFIVCDPNSAALLSSTRNYQQFSSSDLAEYGAGLTGVGTWGSTLQVFIAEWFTANTILVIGKGNSWNYTGAVYAPYIPLFVSPQDYNASTNTLARSVASRQAMAVLNGNMYGIVNVKFGTTGVPPFSTA